MGRSLSRTWRAEVQAAGCAGKQRWPSAQAVRKAYRNRSIKLRSMNIFRCEFCGGFHIGRAVKKPGGFKHA